MTLFSIRDTSTDYSVALPTATVSVGASNGTSYKVRCLFDIGSQRSFIDKNLASQLGLRAHASLPMIIQGFGGAGEKSNYELVKPVVSLGTRKKRLVMAVVSQMPTQVITPGLQKLASELEKMGYKLADDKLTSDMVGNIELLIGADFLARYVTGFTTVNNVDLIKTPGGYLIYGQISPGKGNGPVTSMGHISDQTLNPDVHMIDPKGDLHLTTEEIPIHKLWDLDTIGINPELEAPEDIIAYEHYQSSVTYINGKYWVELPFKLNAPPLPHNYYLAKGQMKSQISKFRKNEQLLSCYHGIIQEYLEMDFIEEVDTTQKAPAVHYLPHHAVLKESSSTPLRIVYNCSAKIGRHGTSLNDCLLTGPSLTEKLGDVLIKFRSGMYGYVADIEKAFMQVGLQLHHRDYTRFLWPSDPFADELQIKTYRFKSVLFGATCSPFLLQMTLQHQLSYSESPLAGPLSRSFYVDNLLGSHDSQQYLQKLYTFATGELLQASMKLHQWNTNSPCLRQFLKSQMDIEFPSIQNVLGLDWNIELDTISLKPCEFGPHKFVTKRRLLSLVSMCFDPLGLCNPVMIKGKLLIQKAWKEDIGWDTHLHPEYLTCWNTLSEEISQLSKIQFPRSVCNYTESYILHVFVDASTSAYGAVCYISGTNDSHVLMSKARVAPLKTKTLPQLELTSLQLGTQLATYASTMLENITLTKIVLWTDSEVALQWVRNRRSKIPYVQNRVNNILKLGKTYVYNHIEGKQNPADLLTRGVSYRLFQGSELWFKGPPWISHEEEWPEQKLSLISCEIVAEIVPKPPEVEPIFDPAKYSHLIKLLNVTKYVFKFINHCKPTLEMVDPLIYWIRFFQMKDYSQIYQHLSSQGSGNLSSTNRQFVGDLGLYLKNELIHSRGRLHQSQLNECTKFPILIPTKSHLASLLILYAHLKCLHGGVQETLTCLRHKYWLPKARQRIKHILGRCVTCKRVEGRKYTYPGPPPLPAERVCISRPFAQVGIDYSGCITVTKTVSGDPEKYYICLFTCTSTRATHLELAIDLTVTTFINLFRRFCAIYSYPSTVISDNGTYFVAGAKFFQELLLQPEVISYMEEHKISWKFIAPRAPWQGGFYERLIGLTKTCLKKVLCKKQVSREELETVLKEIQGRINNRPLTYLNEDGPQPLTPSHLLYGRVVDPLPPVFAEEDTAHAFQHEDLTLQFNKISHLILNFQKLWTKDYLTALREKHYGAGIATQNRAPQVGDIVLIEQPKSQHSWPLGKIVKLHPDNEGIVRLVEVLHQGNHTKRTVDKLVPLEVTSAVVDEPEEHPTPRGNVSEMIRPLRDAARRAAQLRQELLEKDQL